MPTLKMAVDARKAATGGKQGKDAIKSVGDQAVKSGKQTEQFDKQLNHLGKTGAGVKKVMAGMFAGIGATMVLRDITSTAIGFEKTMSELAAVTNATQEQMMGMSAAAREMGATTKFSAREAGDSLVFLARAGFTANDAITALPSTLNLAAAGAIDLGLAGDIASNVLSQFRLNASDMNRVADVMVNTANSANTNISMLAETMKFAGPVAGALGVSLEEAAAGAGVLGDSGIQASLAGTNLRGVMARLLNVSSQGSKALKDMGLTLAEVNPATNKLTTIFRRLHDANMSANQALAIFGRLQVAGALTLSASIDKFEDLTEANTKAKDVAEKAAKIMADNLAGSLKSLRSAIEEVYLQMGEDGLTGGLRTLVEVGVDTVRVMGGIESEAGNATRVLAAGIEGLTVAGASYIALKLPVAIALSTASMIKQSSAAKLAAISTDMYSGATIRGVTATNLLSLSMMKLRGVLIAHPVLALAAVFGGIYAAVKAVNYIMQRQREETDRLNHTYRGLIDNTEEWRLTANRLKFADYMGDAELKVRSLRDQLRIVKDELINIRGNSDLMYGAIEVDKIVPEMGDKLKEYMTSNVEYMKHIAAVLPEEYNKTLKQYFKRYDEEAHKWAANLPKLQIQESVGKVGTGMYATLEKEMVTYVQTQIHAATAASMFEGKMNSLMNTLKDLGVAIEDPRDKLDLFAEHLKKRGVESSEASAKLQQYVQELLHEREVLKATSEEERIRIQLTTKFKDEIAALTPIMRRAYIEMLVNTQLNTDALKKLKKEQEDETQRIEKQNTARKKASTDLWEYIDGLEAEAMALVEGESAFNAYSASIHASNLATQAGIENVEEIQEQVKKWVNIIDNLRSRQHDPLQSIEQEIDLLKMTNVERNIAITLMQIAEQRQIAVNDIDEQTIDRVKRLNKELDFTVRMRDMGAGISSAFGRGLEDIVFQAGEASEIISNMAEGMGRSIFNAFVTQPITESLTSFITNLAPDVSKQSQEIVTAETVVGIKQAAAISRQTQEIATAGQVSSILTTAGVALNAAMVAGAKTAASLLAGGGAIAGGAMAGGAKPSAHGRLFTPAAHGMVIERAQSGTILNQPTLFQVSNTKSVLAGEAGDEAIMPVKRNPRTGNLGVEAIGGGGNTYNLTININGSQGGSDVRKSARQIFDDLRLMTR
jgi:TP901 family phage tail tape measure protein